MSEQTNLTAPETTKIGRRAKPDDAEEIPTATTTTRTGSVVAVESPKRQKVEPAPSTIGSPNRSAVCTSPRKPLFGKEKSDSAADESSTGCSAEESSGGGKGGVKAVDLVEADWLKSDNSSSSHIFEFDSSVVSSPESEVCVELPEKEMEMEMESKSSRPNTHRRSMVFQPTAEELEEFFSAAEKIEAQRFKDKYNFDIVNDVPVKGRFEWSRVKH